LNYDLTHFELSDMTHCGAALRAAGDAAGSMEQAAEGIVRYLYDRLAEASGARSCALVRLFTTLDYADLDRDLREFGDGLMRGHRIESHTKCLTLLATAGDEPAWNSRLASTGHKTIPLPSEHVVEQIPMISKLIRQLGLDVGTILRPDPELLLELDQRSYNVFHVPRAEGSPFIPAQAGFVVPHGIRSVLGFGGLFPTGNMFAVLMFTRVEIPRKTAEMFRTAALNAKIALLPFSRGPFFQ
jgi:hypothetical protein